MKIKVIHKGAEVIVTLSKKEAEILLKRAVAKHCKDEFPVGKYGCVVEWEGDKGNVRCKFYRK